MAALPASELARFTGVQWGAFVLTIILGLRLSFPMPGGECPGWDHAAARHTLGLGPFLEAFSGAEEVDAVERAGALASAGARGMDVLSAGKVVVGVVRNKYERRLAALEAAEAQQAQQVQLGVDESLQQRCPMLDGSLDTYLQSWDDSFRTTTSLTGQPQPAVACGMDTGSGAWDQTPTATASAGTQPVVFHDLWATMTMGWTRDGFGDVDFGGI